MILLKKIKIKPHYFDVPKETNHFVNGVTYKVARNFLEDYGSIFNKIDRIIETQSAHLLSGIEFDTMENEYTYSTGESEAK